MFYLELTTGLRKGELVAPLWSVLDVKEQILSISKSTGRINGEVKASQMNFVKQNAVIGNSQLTGRGKR